MPRKGISLIDLPEKYQKQAAAQLSPAPDLRAGGAAVLEPGPKRLRQSSAKLNKTEQAFLEHLQRTSFESPIHVQAITLLLANGVRYTPDFVVAETPDSADPVAAQAYAYEVKGFMRDDAAVKIKVAAAAYPWMDFILVWRKGRTSPWQFQKILR